MPAQQWIALALWVLLLGLPLGSLQAEAEQPALAAEMEEIRLGLVQLRRDLAILEEDLLYPASSQLAVYLAVDVGEFFALDAVTHHLYTHRQVEALHLGGVQRLYIGNVRQGQHELTAVFTGKGPQGREYRRATSVSFEKTFEPVYVELSIQDSTASYQPEFFARVSP